MRWQILFEGKGFRCEMDDGYVCVGFFTARRVIADNATEAFCLARARLFGEEKVKMIKELSEQQLGREVTIVLKADTISRISWWCWWFGKHSKAFMYYADSDE